MDISRSGISQAEVQHTDTCRNCQASEEVTNVCPVEGIEIGNHSSKMSDILKAPFPYFGGKSSVAHIVWAALGKPDHYMEPFFGSGAVLLARPDYVPQKTVETVNDKDGFIANVWRSIQFSPEETAKWCDWPVNHADLAARKAALIRNEDRLIQNLIADEKWHDPIMAGYWIWAASCWIGSGLTRPGAIPRVAESAGVHSIGKRPHIAGAKGVHFIGKRPHLSGAMSSGVAVHSRQSDGIYAWMQQLSERLRYVRVVCGDWTRVCGGNWQDNLGQCGIFFDPPYAAKDRSDCYHKEDFDVAHDVRAWAIERGKKPSYRIVIAGYDEHSELADHGWTLQEWRTSGGYAKTAKGDSRGKKNKAREVLWFSPYCLKQVQTTLQF